MKEQILIAALCFLFVAGCSVRAPEVQVTGEKTALENQVLGTYEEIEDDSWMVASTRAAQSGQPVKLSLEKKEVLEAVQNRKFNKDDIDEFKRDGALGENNEGLLELRPLARLDTDPDYRTLVTQIMEEENRDRKIIYDRVMEVNPAAGGAGVQKVYSIFAKLNRDDAEAGMWIQQPDGRWLQKGKAEKAAKLKE